jgi:hypothetical protein
MSPLAVFPCESGTGATADIHLQVKTITGGRVANMLAALGRLASGSWTALLNAEAELALAVCATPRASIHCTTGITC